MKLIITIIMILQGVLLSASLEKVEVSGVEAPLIFEKDSTLPIASLQLIFRNSGSIEDKSYAGLAKFSANILNEGTKKLGSVEFANELEKNAIGLSAHIGTETFVIELSSLKEKFGEGINLLKDLLKDPNFTDDTFEKIKLLMKAKIKKNESNFDYVGSLNLKQMRYKNTPIGLPFDGDEKSLNAIKLDDVKNFITNHIVLDRAIIVIGGDIVLDEAKKISKDILSVLPRGKSEPLAHFEGSRKSDKKEIIKDTQQAYIYFGSPYDLNISSDEVYKAKVGSFILGAGGFGSRMMEEIRVKKGLAYSVYSNVNFNKSYSEFSGYLQTKLESQDDAINSVKSVISSFVKDGVTKDELEQAKNFLLGSEPLRNEKLSQRLSRSFFEYYSGFELGHSKRELEKIKTLTLEDLNRFISSHDEINLLSFAIVKK